jgi:hypothetical protein
VQRDTAPLLEPIEAAFNDVPAAVAGLLLVAEVDRPARLLAAAGDLVVLLGMVALIPRSRSHARFAFDG